MTTLPSDWTTSASTRPAMLPGVKVVSSEPSALSRARLLRGMPLKAVNSPPMTSFPSACTAMA